MPEKAYSHRFSGNLILPDCLEGFPVAAVYQIDHKENGKSGKTPAPPDGGKTRKPLEPQCTVCQGLCVCKDYTDYFSKPEGGDGKVIVSQSKHRSSNQKTDNSRHSTACKEGRQEGKLYIGQKRNYGFQEKVHRLQLRRHGQKCTGIGSHSHKTRVAEGEKAGKSVYQIKTESKGYIDPRKDENSLRVSTKIPVDKGKQQDSDYHCNGRINNILLFHTYTFSPFALPRIPDGRTSRITMRRINAKASL